MKTNLLILFLSLSLGMISCVSSKKHKALQADYENLQKMLDTQKSKVTDCENSKMDLEKQLAKVKADLSSANSEINKFQGQVAELEKMNKAKEGEIQRIKDELRSAFSSVNAADLTITQVGDKLYVSLPNKILYRKGSQSLNKNGQTILKNLAEVFKKNDHMSIIVEGHADKSLVKSDAPYKDNLDLSTLRATNVVRYLISQKVKENQLTAAGRSNFEPTGQGNNVDRRIEFIISPDVTKLYELSKKK